MPRFIKTVLSQYRNLVSSQNRAQIYIIIIRDSLSLLSDEMRHTAVYLQLYSYSSMHATNNPTVYFVFKTNPNTHAYDLQTSLHLQQHISKEAGSTFGR